jgi:tetratricopeptide (TPR) repeat protein
MSRVGKRLGALVAGPLFVGLAACGTPQTPAQTATNLVTQGLKAQLAGDLATAAHDYQQAIQTDANNTVSHYDLGTIYDQQGNVAKAVGEYQATLVINPTFTDAVFRFVDCRAVVLQGHRAAAHIRSRVVEPRLHPAEPGSDRSGKGRLGESDCP